MTNTKPQTETVEFQGETREYFVGERDLPTRMGVDAPRYWVNYNQENRELWLSDEIPEEHRPRMALHELFEFESDSSGKTKCLDALKYELSRIPRLEQDAYIPFRKEVFQELVNYLTRLPEDNKHRVQMLPEATESLRCLEDLEKVSKALRKHSWSDF